MPYYISAIWIDHNGDEVPLKYLSPESQHVFETNFNHTWVFKIFGSNAHLLAKANGLEGKYFEGCKFRAQLAEETNVTIKEGNFHSQNW